MLKKFLQFIVFLTAFITGFIGIFSSIVLYEISTPDNYSNAITESGIVKTLVSEIDVYSAELYDKSQESNSESGQNEFGPRLMYRIYQEFRTQIDLELLINLTLEKNILNITDWLKGKRDNIYIFIPKSYLISNIDNTKLKKAILNVFNAEVDKIMTNLPVCTGAEEQEVLSKLDAEFNPEAVTCRSTLIKDKIENIISERLPIQEENLMEEILDANLGDIEDETKLSKLSAQSGTSPKEFNQNLQNIQWYLKVLRTVGFALIIFSLTLTLILFLTLEKPRKLWKPAAIYLSIGVLLMLIWLLIDLLYNKGLTLLLQRMSTELDKLPTNANILEIFQKFISTLASNLTNSILIAGIILTVVSTVIIIVSYIRKSSEESKSLAV